MATFSHVCISLAVIGLLPGHRCLFLRKCSKAGFAWQKHQAHPFPFVAMPLGLLVTCPLPTRIFSTKIPCQTFGLLSKSLPLTGGLLSGLYSGILRLLVQLQPFGGQGKNCFRTILLLLASFLITSSRVSCLAFFLVPAAFLLASLLPLFLPLLPLAPGLLSGLQPCLLLVPQFAPQILHCPWWCLPGQAQSLFDLLSSLLHGFPLQVSLASLQAPFGSCWFFPRSHVLGS